MFLKYTMFNAILSAFHVKNNDFPNLSASKNPKCKYIKMGGGS